MNLETEFEISIGLMGSTSFSNDIVNWFGQNRNYLVWFMHQTLFYPKPLWQFGGVSYEQNK